MQFRVRSSSKKANNQETALVEFPSRSLLPLGSESSLQSRVTFRLDQVQTALASFQSLYKKQRELSNTSFIQIQKRLDRVEYKAFNAEQDLRQLNEMREIRSSPVKESYNTNAQNDISKNQIMLLKQIIFQEKQAQKETIKHQNSIIQQLTLKQIRAEQDLKDLIVKQRIEYDSRLSGHGEEIRQIDGLKQRKIDQQYQIIKGVISNTERRISDDIDRKIKNQTVVRDYVDDKLVNLKEELANEHKQTLFTQTKFIRQTKQSMESLFGLITNLKKEISAELSETQKITISSIKRLAMTVDIAREKTTDDIKALSSSQSEMNNQIIELRTFMTNKLEQNRQIISQFQENSTVKIDEGALDFSSKEKRNIDNGHFSFLQKSMNEWKSLTQQKNLNVFKQISSTIKAIKLQLRKQNDEVASELAALDETVKTLRKSAPNELKKSVQAIITIFNNEFDVLAQELQTLTEMMALSKKESQKIMKDEVYKTKADLFEQIKALIHQKSKQASFYADKIGARIEENVKIMTLKEIKFISDVFSPRIDKIQNQFRQLESTFKKGNTNTTSQLEDYSLKLKVFNQNYKQYLQDQRKEDMRKRLQLEQTMRKNASNLMDMCYKKSQFLVEGLKKNIQTAQIKQKMQNAQALDNTKSQIKKQIQSTKSEIQKDLSANVEKITKERQNSQQILHETIEQSIINAKTNLTNELANTKIQIEEKLSEIKLKELQKQAEHEQQMIDLKNTLFQMIRDEKKLAEESLINVKKTIEEKIILLEKQQQQKDLRMIEQAAANKKEMENYVNNLVSKEAETQKEHIKKKIIQNTQQISGNISKLSNDLKIYGQNTNKYQIDHKAKETQIENKIKVLAVDIETKDKSHTARIDQINNLTAKMQTKQAEKNKIQEQKLNQLILGIEKLTTDLNSTSKLTFDKIQQISKKTNQAQIKQNQQAKAREMTINQMKSDLQKQMKDRDAQIEVKHKLVTSEVDGIKKQLNQSSDKLRLNTSSIEKNVNEIKSQMQKYKNTIGLDIDSKNKATNQKIEQINQKVNQMHTAKQKDQTYKVSQQQINQLKISLEKTIKDLQLHLSTQSKANNNSIEQINKKIELMNKQKTQKVEANKINDESIKQIKSDLQKQINQLQLQIKEVQNNNKAGNQQQAVSNLKKSVNKLQAMFFSEQAKSKALFDQLTTDVNKVSQHLSLIANEMRE